MWAKQSTAATLIVGPILDSTGAEYTSAVIGDLSISKNGGTLTAMASAATLTHIANGQYTLVTTTGNLDTLGRAQITCNKSTYQMPTVNLMVVPANVFDSMVLGTDALDVSAIQFSGQTITAAAGVTVPSSIASPTNITAATGVVLSGVTHTGAVIPTVSTVTNGVTVTTNNDKTGYTASTVSDKTGYSLLATTGLGNQTANITGSLSGSVGSVTGAVGSVTSGVTVSDKTGFSLSQAFPSNFASLGINSSGHVSRVVLVDTTTTNTDMRGTNSAALASAWTATRAGYLDGVLLAQNYNQRTVQVTGSNHIAADVHEFQAEVITSSDFAVGAIDSNALAQDAADKIAETVSDLQIFTRLDSMIESDGAGQFRFDTIALSMGAGGGGGGTDWTANERTAIRSILGFDASGTVSLPTVGVMDAIKDKTDLITSGSISVIEDRVNNDTITMQYNESTTATVNLDENTTSATLQFVVSRPDGTDILTIANGSITRTSTSFTVTITTAVTATLGQYLWSLRDITGGTNRVVTKGVLTVQNAASA